MPPHFRRFGWLYAVCLFAVGWPALMFRLQMVPPLDKKAVFAIAEWRDSEFQRGYGPSAMEDIQALEERPETKRLRTAFGNDPRVRRLLALMQAAPALEEDVSAVGRAYGAILRETMDLGKKGNWYVPIAPVLRKLDPSANPSDAERERWWNRLIFTPDFLFLQTSAKLLRVESGQSALRGDWSAALAQLDESALIGDPARASSGIGYLIAAVTRATAYGGYTALLNSNPPEEVERLALNSLIALRASDPQADRLLWMTEGYFQMAMLISLGDQRRERIGVLRLVLEQSISQCVRGSRAFPTAALRSWAARFSRKLESANASSHDIPYRWTEVCAETKWLREVSTSTPDFLRQCGFPDHLVERIDPWTAAFMAASLRQPEADEAGIRGRATATYGRLAELAYAARLYRKEHGQMPERLEDLIPAFVPPFEGAPATQDRPTSATEGPSQPYAPFAMGWLRVEDPLRAALWKVLPMLWEGEQLNVSDLSGSPTLEAHSPESYNQSAGRAAGPAARGYGYGYGYSGGGYGANDLASWRFQPVLPLAMEEIYRAHPALVETAQAEELPPDPRRSWQPIDPTEARRVTDEHDIRWEASMPADSLPPDAPRNPANAARGASKPSQALPFAPAAVRFTACLKAPEKAFVIWSAGPDGVDDGGRICYDPTNGTTSRGDLLVFPEGY
ncbi:MAG: hypothetical protein NTW86_16150 [Candidatus Sumerlaeota bacterium]|nr:hypothetical protein [Candidatus Sumerlaeota bacterium]